MGLEVNILGSFALSLKFFSFFLLLKYFRFPLPLSAIIAISFGFALSQLGQRIVPQSEFYFLTLNYILQGILLAIPWILLFEFIPLGFKLIDILRGIFIAEQQFPGIESRQSSLENLAGYLTLILFFSIGGFEILIDTLFADFKINNLEQFVFFVIKLSNEIIKISFLMIFPVLIILFLLELLQIFVAKFIARLSISGEFQSLKICIAIFLLLFLLEKDIYSINEVMNQKINLILQHTKNSSLR